ncbi:unnamed protein product [Vitrella brassicaformis CCMP3155]|uniref:DUF1995 domain-containing protein n=1 Tax=Vitrella brassicaformis (strain CCMP3155) TaxID=1169540 RepID=A0A0G4FZQ6_VITBC|nr:unnamed protein product [Vitrella brassicaformis CCMP3155]|eukprot:CEM21128.1 unnamed protein product [Vitrella brassicaformis CCMP3155]
MPLPASIVDCIAQAAEAIEAGYRDRIPLMEVDFPPLPADVLNSAQTADDDVFRANLKYAVDLAVALVDEMRLNVTVYFKDAVDCEAAMKLQGGGSQRPYPNVTLSSIRVGYGPAESRWDSVAKFLQENVFNVKGDLNYDVAAADIYLLVGFGGFAYEDIRWLHQQRPDTPIVLINCLVDRIRGDLGLGRYPPKEFHYQFLSQIKPVYFLKFRNFAETGFGKAPIFFNGILFRAYPGTWQSLLEVAAGEYKLIKNEADRPSFTDVRNDLLEAVGGDPSYRDNAKPWWEENFEGEASDAWRK